MRLKKLVLYLMAAVMLGIPAAGCASQSPIAQAVICRGVSKAGEPMMAGDSLAPDADTIYCSVKLAAPSAKSKVRAEWYLVKSEEAGLSDLLIGNETVPGDAPYAVFAFARSDKLLPRGDYQVKLYVDDTYVQSAPFKVEGKAAPSGVTLSEAVTCSGADPLTGKSLQAVKVFPNNASSVFCSARVNGAKFDDRVTARWIYRGGELAGVKDKLAAESTLKIQGSEYISFSFGPKSGSLFPTGDYTVGLYVGDKEQALLPFSVVDWKAIPGPYVGEAMVFAYKDADRKEVNPGPQFPADTTEVNLAAKIYNFPAGTKLTTRWIITKSDDAGVDNYTIKEDTQDVEAGATLISVKLTSGKEKFVKGDYAVSLLVEGKETAFVPFRVQ